ncbi:C40 family peptidase [Collinsella sp. AGMB00827]|uniref:C40 family peptidase n=1 Tax=Collinsella ureilytica TaxID=2869515 RepID=A0ABS7MI82_9ACTN|nr:C40 family peptidase [Collinsella urealyticum]MBY4797069.1 C40 family peptidase [Collinsella urealyticum]
MKRSTSRLRAVPIAVLAGLMTFTGPVVPVAYAVNHSVDALNSELAQAQKKLDELTRNLEIAGAKAEETQAQIDETNEQIEALKVKIEEGQQKASVAQQSLKETVRGSYKDGNATLLDIVLSADDFSDLTSRLFYASAAAQKHNEKIASVNAMVKELNAQRGELDHRESELKELHDQQAAAARSLAASQNEAKKYVDGLSSELRAALEAERAAKAEEQRRAAEEAARQAQAQAQAEQSSFNAGNTSSAASSSSNSSSSSESSYTPAPQPSASSGGLDGSVASTIISAATAQLGLPYSYGASSPGVAFDCSGLTSYAYAQAGISIPHSSRAQYAQVRAAGNLKSGTGSLAVGDLVFYQSGGVIYHVAIYIGGGQVVHANGYGQGVVITGVTYDAGFCGGGSPV